MNYPPVTFPGRLPLSAAFEQFSQVQVGFHFETVSRSALPLAAQLQFLLRSLDLPGAQKAYAEAQMSLQLLQEAQLECTAETGQQIYRGIVFFGKIEHLSQTEASQCLSGGIAVTRVYGLPVKA